MPARAIPFQMFPKNSFRQVFQANGPAGQKSNDQTIAVFSGPEKFVCLTSAPMAPINRI
jgi:hypothetical protein